MNSLKLVFGLVALVYVLIGCSKSARPLTNNNDSGADNLDNFYDPIPSITPLPSPSPTPPPPGVPNCEIERLTPYTNFGQALSFKLNVFGSFTSALVNGRPINPQTPISILPDVTGSYRATAFISNGAGSSSCEALFVPPSCSLELVGKTNGAADLKMNLAGGISFASLEGENQLLPLPPNRSILYRHHASGGTRTVTGVVRSAQGDTSSCSLTYSACESERPVIASVNTNVNKPLFTDSAAKPADLVTGLNPGDRLKVTEISTNQWRFGPFSSQFLRCDQSDGLILQLANANRTVLVAFSGSDPSRSYSLPLNQIMQMPNGISIPGGATKAVGSIIDSVYNDNNGICEIRLSVIPACSP